ncbi:MAG: hypothetical protein AAF721_03815 [Myxococcota bacterium]
MAGLIAALGLVAALADPRTTEPLVRDHVPLTTEFYGRNVTRPGLRVATEFAVLGRRVDAHRRRGGVRRRDHELLVLPRITGYVHPGHSIGLLLDGALAYRLTHPGGFRFEVVGGLGYLRTFLPAPTYVATSDTRFRRERGAGDDQLAASFELGFGYDFTVRPPERSRVVTALFGRVGLLGQFPHNTRTHPVLIASLGVSFGVPRRRPR